MKAVATRQGCGSARILGWKTSCVGPGRTNTQHWNSQQRLQKSKRPIPQNRMAKPRFSQRGTQFRRQQRLCRFV